MTGLGAGLGIGFLVGHFTGSLNVDSCNLEQDIKPVIQADQSPQNIRMSDFDLTIK